MGTLDYVKAVVTADTVLPEMTICKQFGVKHSSLVTSAMALRSLGRNETIVETLNIDPQEISGGFEDVDKKIRIGDLVRKIR